MATTIAHEQSLCIRSFDRLCEAMGNGNSGYSSQLRISSILDEYGRFNVWSGNIGAHQVGRVSLDHRLREADHVKEQVIRLLQYLRETLDDATSIVDGSRLPYEDVHSSSESESSEEEMPPGTMPTDSKLPQDVNSLGTELQQLMHGIGKITANLFKLSTMIRKGNVSHDRLLKSSKIDVSYYESYDIQHAKNRFPSANERLTDRMGKAISRRRQYLKYREQHHEKLAVPFTDSTASNLPAEDSEQFPNFESVPRSKTPTCQQSAGCATSIRNQASVIQSTNASTFIPSKVPEPVNLDVDVYSEADTQTSHATSVAGEDKLRVPPPPESSRDGRDFECPYCYIICRLNGKEEWQRRREWKRHVYKDLQPYMCTFDSCFKAEVMFEKRRDWFNHELQVHRREWCCNATNHEAYRDKADFIEHMKRAHADSYDHADLRNVVSLFERPSTTTTASCPFCISEETEELSISRLEKHIARHMEILALFSLPRSNDTYKVGSVQSGLYVEASHESEDESVANNGGGNPLERLPTASPTKGDSDSSELQPLSLFDNVLHSFCAVEAARDTSVPKYFLQGENKNKSLQLRKSNSELRWALVRKVDRLADGDIKIADFLTGLHTTCNTELENIPDSVDNLRSTVNHFIYDIVGSIECSIDYYLNSFESSDDRLHDTKYRVSQLRQDMGESLGEGQETGQTSISSNVNWDHVQPKVMITASTITFFSRALATTQDLTQLVPAHGPSFDGLKRDLETLIRTLNGVTFDRSMADEVERKVWSQESAIAQYCLLTEVPKLSDEENTKASFLRIPFVGTVMNVVGELLEILKAAPLNHQETVEEPGDLMDSDTRDSRNVVSWIRGQSPEQIIRHQTALAEWQPGTSRWFLDSSEYKIWTQRVTPRLNVLGNPDCGKTMLCAAVVEHLKVHVVSRTVGIAYYYWHNLADNHLRATDLLRSIFSQFWLHTQSLHETPPPLQALFALCNPSNLQPSREDLIAVFAAIVRLFDSCYIVIDGLEYCSDYSSFLEVVQGLEPRVCTMVTSRRSARLGQFLADQPSFHTSIRSFIIDESHVAVDAEVVLRAKVALAKSPRVFMDEMTNIILQQACGMFSWAVLQSERVLDCDSEYDAKSVLDNAPTQIYNSWHHNLLRTFSLHKDSAVFVKHFLEILSAATRPLSHIEFEYFYESHLNRSPHIDRNLVPVSFLKIETICSDFVAVVTRSEIAKSYTYESIKLVHPQLKNLLFSCYLGETKFWELGVSKTQANLHMAESCLTYLLSFNGTIDANDTIFPDRYSLLRYAAQNWYIHATESDVLCLQTLLLGLFTSEVCFATWLSVHDPDAPDRSIPEANPPSPLYYACLLGFYDLAKTLLGQGARLDEIGGKHNYPLLAAVASGHREVVRMLLDEKDEANRRFKNGDTAIIRAASEGRADIVQLLLTHGGDPNAKDERRLTALHWAIRWEQYGIVPLLLDSEAEINAKDLDGRTALYHTLCVEKPNTYTFNLLIAKGVDVLEYDIFGKTMLNYAVTKKYLEGMQSLLAAGAQVDMGDHRGWTALHEATSILWFEGVDYLLSSCYADPDLQDKFGQTALHCALFLVSKKNHQDPYWDRMSADIIKRLLSSSADQSLPDSGGRTPLDIVRSCRSDGLGDVSKVLQSAQAQENLMPVVLYLKHKHLNMTFPVKLAAFDSEKGAFKIGLLRRRAAKMSGVSDAQMIRLFFNSGTFNRELCDDTKACKDEGLKHKSEVFYVVRKEDGMTGAVEETFNVSGNSIDEDRRLEAKQSRLRGTDMTLLDDLRDGHQTNSDEKPITLLHQDISQGDEVHAKTPNSPGMSTDDGSANAFIEVDMEHEEERSLEFVNSHVETPTSFQEVHLRMEIFNSLSNSHHDTCEKLLPAALNKLDIDGDWREYALHIVYDGGEELCLSLSDKPWVVYYELAAGQHKPRLMVRRHGPRAAPSRDVGVGEQITSPLRVPRSYHCDHCPQCFNRLHDLKRHKKTHTGLKPFRCQYCDKTFTREAALKVHIKRCGRVASSSANSAEEGTDTHANAGSHEESPPPVVDDVSIESETAISGELHDDEQKEPSFQRQELLHQPVSRIPGGDKSANTNNHLNRLLYMVTFKALRADLYCVLEATELHVEKGDLVIVEADRGEDLGTIASDAVPFTEAKRTQEEFDQEHQKWLMLLSHQTQTHNITRPISNSQPQLSNNTVGVMSNGSSQGNNAASYLLRPKMIKRLALSHETHTLKDKETREANAKRVCQEQAIVLGLNIEILEADFQMDRKKLTFYYFAHGYINLSPLIKDLFKIYATRIWMSAANPTTLAGGPSTNDDVEGRRGKDALPVMSAPKPRPSHPESVLSGSSLQDGAHPSSSTLLPEVSPSHGAGLSTPLSIYASFSKPSIASLKMYVL